MNKRIFPQLVACAETPESADRNQANTARQTGRPLETIRVLNEVVLLYSRTCYAEWENSMTGG